MSDATDPGTLILLRHGESEWNLANRFTGWTDVDLSPKGVEEATAAGRLLRDEGYITDYESIDDDRQGVIRIGLKYLASGDAAIRGMERVSRPSRRIYRGKDEIPKVLNGLGVVIVSTAAGVLTGSACHQQGVGGEVLCNIW